MRTWLVFAETVTYRLDGWPHYDQGNTGFHSLCPVAITLDMESLISHVISENLVSFPLLEADGIATT